MQRTKEFIATTCDWVITVGVGLVGLLTLWTLGGWPWHGSVLLSISWLIGFLGLVQGVWWVTTPERPRKIRKLTFIVLPLLAYVLLQGVTRGADWLAWPSIWPWFAAAGIWLLILHNVRTRLRIGVLGIILLVGFFASSIVAIYQFYQEPDLLTMGRDSLPMFRWRGSGTLANPEWMATIALIAFPSLAVIALMRRLPGVSRLAAASMAFMAAIVVLVSGSISGFWLLIAAFCTLPWVTLPDRRKRWKLFTRTILGFAAAGLLVWAASEPLWDTIVRSATLTSTTPTVPNQDAGLHRKILSEAPFVMGYGPGMEVLANLKLGSPTAPSEYVLPTLWQRSPFYDTYGILGIFFLAAPLIFLLWIGMQRWLSEPWVHLNKEDRERLVNLEAEAKAEGSKSAARNFRRHLRSRGHYGPAPLVKVLLPTLGLGLIFGCAQAWFSGALCVPTVLFHLTILAALFAKIIDWESIELPRHKLNSSVGLAVICLVFGLIWLAAQKSYIVTRAYFDAREQMDALMADRSQLRYTPTMGSDAIFAYESVLTLAPDHLQARTELAALYLWIAQNSNNITPEEAGRQAKALLEPHLETGHWPYILALYAMALAAEDAPFQEVWEHIDNAAQAALQEPSLQDMRKSANAIKETTPSQRQSSDFFGFTAIPIPHNLFSAGMGRPHDIERYKTKDERN